MPKLNLDRATLAKLLQNNQRAIVAFEQVLGDVGGTLPSTIEEANNLAGQALATAHSALSTLAVLAEAIERLEGAPALPPVAEPDDAAPRVHLGTISAQDADQVEIAGGTAALSTISASGQITSTVPDGTAPLIIASKTKVTNLYADRAAIADSLGVAASYPPNATDLPTVIALANALRAANTAKGV